MFRKSLILIKGIVFKGLCTIKHGRQHVKKCKINGFTKLNGNECFGENINFNGASIYGKGRVTIGDNFHSAKGLVIMTSYHNYNGDSIPYDKTIITKDVVIGENVWIGMNVIILAGVKIGEGAIIQAGSVVVNDIMPLGIAGGSPAKVFKNRNEDHYYSLKENKLFL